MKKNTYIYIAIGVAAIAAAIIVYRMMNKNRATGSTGTNYAAGELDPVQNPMSGASGASVGGAAAVMGLEAASAAQVSQMLQMTTATK